VSRIPVHLKAGHICTDTQFQDIMGPKQDGPQGRDRGKASSTTRSGPGRNEPLNIDKMTPYEALQVLERLMDRTAGSAIKLFHEFHHNYERGVNVSPEEACAILFELGRSILFLYSF
jgi:hypothetical protein